MPDLLTAIQHAEQECHGYRVQARVARRDAEQAWRVARAPDANLRLMLAELSAQYDALRDDNNRLRGELAALVAMVEGEP